MTCFSYRNGPAWNHFTAQQIIDLFSGYFELGELAALSLIGRRWRHQILLFRFDEEEAPNYMISSRAF